jgi:hypothetical protein
VRSVRASDEAGLSALYDGLDTDDRYLRFFCCGYRPASEFFQKLANPGPREARVVADRRDAGGTTLIAEAGYSILPNGNGEFAMVVAKPWRGWLGPYLLDLVVELADGNGVPNLEAEVLTINSNMLALLRARGCVFLGHDGWNELRTMVGTGEQGPTWPGDADQPRVLVEAPGGRWPLEDAADAAGMRVITCTGPAQNAACPVLSGEECALVARADAIVVRNAPAGTDWDEVVANHSASHPDIPVVIDRTDAGSSSVTVDDVRVPAFFHFYMRTAADERAGEQATGTVQAGMRAAR